MNASKITRYALASGVIIAAVLLAALLNRSNTMQPSPASTQPAESGVKASASPTIGQDARLVRDVNFGAWKYTAWVGKAGEGMWDDIVIGPGQVYASVMYSNTSEVATKAYIEANKSALPQVAAAGGEAEIYVVFKDYIPVAQFRSWAESYKLRTGMSWLRMIDETESPKRYIMVQGNQKPDGKTILSDADVAEHMKVINSWHPNAKLKGVFATHAWINSAELTKIADDPIVFYIDVTPNIVRRDLAAANVEGGTQAAVHTSAPFVFSLIENIDTSTPIPVPSPTLPEPIDTPQVP